MLEQKLMEELNRHKAINKYTQTMILEQDMGADAAVPAIPPADPLAAAPPVEGAPADPLAAPPVEGAPADPLAAPPVEGAPVDAAAPPVEGAPVDAAGGTEEIDITDLVNMTKNIKNQLDSSKDNNNDVIQKMDGVFSKLSDLEQKLAQMDSVMAKIDELGNRIEQVKPKTPQEKLEMRSLDSYPFNQHPQDFFSQKQEEMRQTGKNEYVLTKDEVESYGKEQIMKSFNPDQDDNEPQY
jgi:hypothetical protein